MQDNRIIPFLALTLYFVMQGIGIYIASVYKPSPEYMIWITLSHFAGMLLMAGLFCALHNHWLAHGKPTPPLFSSVTLLLVLAAVVLAVSHYISANDALASRHHFPWIRPFVVSFFWPVAIYMFFQTSPHKNRGLLLGLAIAAGDLCSLMLLPSSNITGLPSGVPTNILLYLHKLQSIIQITLALMLVACIALAAKRKKTEQTPPYEHTSSNPNNRIIWKIILAGAMVFLLVGVASNAFHPKLNPSISTRLDTHLLFFFTSPLTGWIIDKWGARGAKRLLLVAACLFVLCPLTIFGAEPLKSWLYNGLLLGSQIFFVCLVILIGMLSRGRRYQMFLFCAVYFLMGMPRVGVALSNQALQASPPAIVCVASLLFILALTLILRTKIPDFFPLEEEKPVALDKDPSPENIKPEEKFYQFNSSFKLSRSERIVLENLIAHKSLEQIAEHRGISERTVKYHLSGLLKKTGTQNRRELILFYQTWHAGQLLKN